MELKKILKDFVNEPYENLVGTAKTIIAELIPIFNEAAPNGDGGKLIIKMLSTALAVDGKLSDLEYKFVCDIFGGIKYEDVKNLLKAHYTTEMMDAVNGFVDSCPVEVKSKLITLFACFLAVDKTFTREEVAFIVKLCQ